MVYGGDVFSAHDFYFWIPVIGPYVGGALAGLLYKHTVEVRKHTVLHIPLSVYGPYNMTLWSLKCTNFYFRNSEIQRKQRI